MDLARTPVILVLDDDDAIRVVAQETLTDAGYHVVAAASAEEARRALAAVRFDLVLTDTVGPSPATDPAFWAGLAALLKAAGDTPVVIFSAHNPERFDGHRERGFAGLLPKPFDLDALVATVRRIAPHHPAKRRKPRIIAGLLAVPGPFPVRYAPVRVAAACRAHRRLSHPIQAHQTLPRVARQAVPIHRHQAAPRLGIAERHPGRVADGAVVVVAARVVGRRAGALVEVPAPDQPARHGIVGKDLVSLGVGQGDVTRPHLADVAGEVAVERGVPVADVQRLPDRGLQPRAVPEVVDERHRVLVAVDIVLRHAGIADGRDMALSG